MVATNNTKPLHHLTGPVEFVSITRKTYGDHDGDHVDAAVLFKSTAGGLHGDLEAVIVTEDGREVAKVVYLTLHGDVDPWSLPDGVEPAAFLSESLADDGGAEILDALR